MRVSERTHGDKILVSVALRLGERGLGESEEKNTGKESHVLCGLVLTAQRYPGGDDGLRCHAVRVLILLCLTASAPQTFEVCDFTHIEVVFVLVENDKRVDRLTDTVVHGRNGGNTEVRRVDAVDKERLERGRKGSLARAFLAEKVKYGEMAGAVEDNIAV